MEEIDNNRKVRNFIICIHDNLAFSDFREFEEIWDRTVAFSKEPSKFSFYRLSDYLFHIIFYTFVGTIWGLFFMKMYWLWIK